jgi:glutathione S-transferase
MADVTLVGRSSSHFTRTARIFARELDVSHAFQPVLDMTVTDAANYGNNPALKVPILVDEQGPLFGTENICRELARRSGQRSRVTLRGDVPHRLVANAEELILHAMSSEVILIMSGKGTPPPKVRPSLENTIAFLEDNLPGVRVALPADRVLSFCETSLFCLVTHLPFRKIMEVTGYPRLQAFCQEFEQRPGARDTGYRFDASPR